MLIVGIMTALVAVFIDICIEQLSSWKYTFLHGCILINIPSPDFEKRRRGMGGVQHEKFCTSPDQTHNRGIQYRSIYVFMT